MTAEENTVVVERDETLEASYANRSDPAHHPEQAKGIEGSALCCSDGARTFSRLAYRAAKRAFDVVFSACVIAVAFMPGLVLCVLVALDTHGTPLYSQERVGMGGKTFRILKFRTMVADSDDVEKYFTSEQLEAWVRERKVDNDPRITKLGSLLRQFSLDELPQFLNALIGQMSVIGPRAISKDELNQHFTPNERKVLLSVPCGITGWWQVSERNDATFESGERQRLELEYVKNAGFSIDMHIFAKTFGAMFGEKTGR